DWRGRRGQVGPEVLEEIAHRPGGPRQRNLDPHILKGQTSLRGDPPSGFHRYCRCPLSTSPKGSDARPTWSPLRTGPERRASPALRPSVVSASNGRRPEGGAGCRVAARLALANRSARSTSHCLTGHSPTDLADRPRSCAGQTAEFGTECTFAAGH